MFGGLRAKAYIVRAAYSFLDKSLKIKPVVQRRLEFLKAVRFVRYVLNGLVRWVACEGLHSLGHIFIFRKSLNKTGDAASAGNFEGRQIWEACFKRSCSLGFL